MAKDTKKYGQILAEYKAILSAAAKLKEKKILSEKNYSRIEQEYKTQHQHYIDTKADIVEINKYLDKMKDLIEETANNIAEFVNEKNPKTVNLINMSKNGLSNIKTAKSDVKIIIDGVPTAVSLKQYEKNSSIQLCSGTFLSTVCSLAFERVGNGKFVDSKGKEFLSKNIKDVKSMFAKHYGDRASELAQKIKDLDNDYWHFRTMEKYPNDHVWKSTTKKVGTKGAQYISDLIQIVSNKSSTLKENILKRTGLDGNHEILKAVNYKKPQKYSTLTDHQLKKKISSLKNKETHIKSGVKGQSVTFSFIDGGKVVTTLLMPCTINKNGAWHIPKDGVTKKYCNKSKKWIEPNHLRPEKAKEMYTSTNFYLDIKKIKK